MNIKINKDFLNEYKNDTWKGLSLNETVSFASAILVFLTVFGIMLWYFELPVTASIYISVPCGAPIVFLGTFKYQNYLGFYQFLKERKRSKKCKCLSYQISDQYNKARKQIWSTSTKIPTRRKKFHQKKNRTGGK